MINSMKKSTILLLILVALIAILAIIPYRQHARQINTPATQWEVATSSLGADLMVKKYLEKTDNYPKNGRAEIYYKGKLVKSDIDNSNDSAFVILFKETPDKIFLVIAVSELKAYCTPRVPDARLLGYIDKNKSTWHELPGIVGCLADLQDNVILSTGSIVDTVGAAKLGRTYLDINLFDDHGLISGYISNCLLPAKYSKLSLVNSKFSPNQEKVATLLTDNVLEPTYEILITNQKDCSFKEVSKINLNNANVFVIDRWDTTQGLILKDEYSGDSKVFKIEL